MGEAKRKRYQLETEWAPLFSPELPARIAISRPGSRPFSVQRYENVLAENIAAKAATDKPTLCLNTDCDTELYTLPEVRVFIRPVADPHAPPIAMAACSRCSRMSDEELRALLQSIFQGYGFNGLPKGAAQVRMDLPIAHTLHGGGLQILVIDEQTDEPVCETATAFALLLEIGALPRFMAFRHGSGNCHSLVRQICLDLKDARCADLFTFKCGSSGALKTDADAEGLHSWIEADGWAIETSNGALNDQILVMPAEDFHALLQLTGIHDITPEPERQNA